MVKLGRGTVTGQFILKPVEIQQDQVLVRLHFHRLIKLFINSLSIFGVF